MNKLKEMRLRQLRLEQKLFEMNGKKFKFPNAAKGKLKRANKELDYVVTQYLTQKGTIEFKLCKIISGNIIVINNKAYRLNPKKLWRFKKWLWYIHREIDREPVSNEDYDEVKERKDDTEADVPLIKAVIGAIQKQKSGKKPNVWVIIGVVVLALIGMLVFL